MRDDGWSAPRLPWQQGGMTIGILQCGTTPSELLDRHGTYAAMMQRMLGERGTATYDVQAGVLPAGPAECEAYVVTGSSSGVYDQDAWIGRLIDFLREARGRARMVGICFGHQAMAVAFGGKVVKSPKGWGIGLQRYDVIGPPAPWMDSGPHVHIPASHQDQVVVPPAAARLTAANAFTPFAGLDYGDAMSFQFHPEFTADFATGLIGARRSRYAELADAALASHAQPDDCARVGRWIGRFLDGDAAPR